MRADIFRSELPVFQAALARQMQKWKSAAGNGSAASRRHMRSLKRNWIRRYKQKTGITNLPMPMTALSNMDIEVPSPEQMNLVILPSDDAGNDRHAMRKTMRRILHQEIVDGSDVRIDLIEAANATGSKLPPVARIGTGSTERVRGIYLDALGVAILPDLSEQEIKELEDAGLDVAENRPFSVFEPPSEVAPATGHAWYLQQINIAAAREQDLDGRGVRIGILDTGIAADHDAFLDTKVTFCAFKADGARLPDQATRDFGIHGTHVSGLCAGTYGVAPAASLVVAAVLTEKRDGKLIGYPTQISAALNWMIGSGKGEAKRVDVINASLGGAVAQAREYRTVLRNARNAGILTIAAVGNDGGPAGRHLAPAAFDHVLAVGAVDHQDAIYTGSAWGLAVGGGSNSPAYKPDLVAPGVAVSSAVPNNGWRSLTGTSMACPLVTGAAALLLQKEPELCQDSDALVARLLELTYLSPNLVQNTIPERYGAGRLDLGKI